MNYEPGMLLSFKWESEVFGICKVIKLTETKKDPIISISTFSNYFDTFPENINLDQLKPMIVHMPMVPSSLTGCTPVGKAEIRPRELEAYERWLDAWQAGRAGILNKSISESVSQILEAMAEVEQTSGI